MEYEVESKQPIQSRMCTIRPFKEKVCQSLILCEPNLYSIVTFKVRYPRPTSGYFLTCLLSSMVTSSHILDIYLSCPRNFVHHIHSLSPTLGGAFFLTSHIRTIASLGYIMRCYLKK